MGATFFFNSELKLGFNFSQFIHRFEIGISKFFLIHKAILGFLNVALAELGRMECEDGVSDMGDCKKKKEGPNLRLNHQFLRKHTFIFFLMRVKIFS